MVTLRHTQPTLFKQVPFGHIVTPLSLLLITRKNGGKEVILFTQLSYVIKTKNL